jgi:hypothetical protein
MPNSSVKSVIHTSYRRSRIGGPSWVFVQGCLIDHFPFDHLRRRVGCPPPCGVVVLSAPGQEHDRYGHQRDRESHEQSLRLLKTGEVQVGVPVERRQGRAYAGIVTSAITAPSSLVIFSFSSFFVAVPWMSVANFGCGAPPINCAMG